MEIKTVEFQQGYADGKDSTKWDPESNHPDYRAGWYTAINETKDTYCINLYGDNDGREDFDPDYDCCDCDDHPWNSGI